MFLQVVRASTHHSSQGLELISQKVVSFAKGKFVMHRDRSNKVDGLKQVLNYVSRELTPPAGKVSKTRSYKKRIAVASVTTKSVNKSTLNSSSSSPRASKQIGAKKRTNSGSFPSGHLSDKSRAKLQRDMEMQQREEMELYRHYEKQREIQLQRFKTMDGGARDRNEHKIREAVTGFDCSRFLLGHLGILTPGHVLGVKDSLFSDVTSDDVDLSKNGGTVCCAVM